MKREINKDTELHPLVRWQFRGLPERDRKAFLFENITDVKGKKYDTPVLVAAHAASREIYALAMMCQPEQISQKWEQAQLKPVPPKLVDDGPVHEEVHLGDRLLEHGGLEEFPIPISTPGFDNAPFLTAGNWVSNDPDTGVRNVGNYRGMVKGKIRLGCSATSPQHLGMHRQKYRDRGVPMPCAVVIGPTPNIGLVATVKLTYGVDEYSIAGGITGEPVELVKCKTIDIEVPATAEIVIEGLISTDYLEREAPFGEYTGYMGMGRPNFFMDITCITHRKNPIWNAFLSQFPPSESSILRGVGIEATYYKFLKHDCGIHNLMDVVFHQESGAWLFCILRLKNSNQAEVWKALYAAVSVDPRAAKIVTAVDEDIDPRDPDSVIWALCYRMQPDRDMQIIKGKTLALDPSAAPPDEIRRRHSPPPSQALLINATRKWDYPPISLPKKQFMEEARRIWEELGLPPLSPRSPWYGISLGHWTGEDEEEAELALRGDHYRTGEKLA